MSSKVLLSRALQKVGVLRVLESLRSKPGILIITHHRIGEPSDTVYDRDLFSATADELDAQVQYFKKRAPIVSGEELERLVSGKTPIKRLYVAFTFDDGYLDNYTKAFDVFRSSGVTATFFLVSDYVGTSRIPWWDEIAYLVRNTKKPELNLTYPAPLTVPLNGHRDESIITVLEHFKRSDNLQSDQFLAEIRERAECELPTPERRYLNWDEAREMRAAGMAIGSHTRSHPILGRLSPEHQRREIEESKRQIEGKLGCKVRGLAYPVGAKDCFSEATQQIAIDAGYSMCFSSYGGINVPENLTRSNLLRGTAPSNPDIFRAVAAVRTSLRVHL